MKSKRLLSCTLTALALSGLPAFAQNQGDKVTTTESAGEAKIELGDTEPLDDSTVKLDTDVPSLPGAPNAVPAPEPAANSASIPGLDKLNAADREKVGKAVGEVSNYMRGVRLQEALQKLNEIEAITGEFFLVENMRGAVYTKMRDFTSARANFVRAIELTKGIPTEQFHPRFNLSEIDFVEKKFEAARKGFTALLSDPTAAQGATRQLMQFKIFICDLKLNDAAGADKILEGFDPNDYDSPVYYFAHAAKEFQAEKKDDAEEWLASAGRIYPKEVNDIYQDSLVEMGWLQTLQ